jgi:hypothetical protein
MDVGRFCGVAGSEANARHQRIADYVKRRCDHYAGMGFTPREEWIVEQTIAALGELLGDIRCSTEERAAIEEFLHLAAQDLPGPPGPP